MSRVQRSTSPSGVRAKFSEGSSTYTAGSSEALQNYTHDFLNRITSVDAGSGAWLFGYQYDALGRRDYVTMAGGDTWTYEYDDSEGDHGQLASAKRRWSDNQYVMGQQFEFDYDDIGNRVSTRRGGDEAGNELRAASYTADALNQYDSRQVPGFIEVYGETETDALVAVNQESVERQNDGAYFRKELSVDNVTGPVYTEVQALAPDALQLLIDGVDLKGASHNVSGERLEKARCALIM